MEVRKTPKTPLDLAEALRQCHERFAGLVEISSDGYWEQDERYRFTLMQGVLVRNSGLDSRAYIGTARWDHGAVPIGDGGSWERHKADLEARKPERGPCEHRARLHQKSRG